MKIIGLSGGIGSGKSTVASILKDLGATLIDSDKVGHEVLTPGSSGWWEVVNQFGREILTPEGTIDRKQLSEIVFQDPVALRALNRIVHPKIEEEVRSRLKIFQKQGVEIAVIEAALIGEAGWVPLAEQIWVVKSSRDTTLKRLKERGLPEVDALARMASQSPAEKHVKRGLVIVNNDGCLTDLKAAVKKLWLELQCKERG
jgi:dephospho-CoA kinase